MNADPVVGLEGLRQASRIARAAGVPLVAIGGITLSRVHELVAVRRCVRGDRRPLSCRARRSPT